MNYNAKCPVPECAKPWSEDFLLDALPRTWMYDEYRKHREKYCLDQERARLPETQEQAKRYIESKKFVMEVESKKAVVKLKLKKLPESIALDKAETIYKNKMNDIRHYCSRNRLNVYYDPSNNAERKSMLDALSKYTQEKVDPLKVAFKSCKEAKRLNLEYSVLQKTQGYPTAKWAMGTWGLQATGVERGTVEDTSKKQWTFTMKCPATECQGFVGLDWACGMCSSKVCEDCREIKDTPEGKHECDPAKKESVKTLRKEAKPCPKCAAQISKIDGCDQMWCTLCHTAFSWNTGAIQEHVHNPHYYDWMRRTGQNIPRADIPRPANLDCLTPRQILREAEFHFRETQLFSWIQPISHILNYSTHNVQYNIRNERGTEEEKRKLRVKRLANEVDDRKWGMALELLNMQKRKHTDANDIYQMFLSASTDIMRAAIPESTNYVQYLKQIEDLVKYTNAQIEKHNSKYRNTMEKVKIPYTF